MDPGQVVWLPGSGLTQDQADQACVDTFGGGYYGCGEVPDGGGTFVYCCLS